jgi:DNA-directed RNA polymerase subunit M/transcription elongation factor TFIIS
MKDTKIRRLTCDPRKIVNYSAQCDNCKIEVDIRTNIILDYVLKKGIVKTIVEAATVFNERKADYVKSYVIEHCGFSMVLGLDTKRDIQEELLYCFKCYSDYKHRETLKQSIPVVYAINLPNVVYSTEKKP